MTEETSTQEHNQYNQRAVPRRSLRDDTSDEPVQVLSDNRDLPRQGPAALQPVTQAPPTMTVPAVVRPMTPNELLAAPPGSFQTTEEEEEEPPQDPTDPNRPGSKAGRPGARPDHDLPDTGRPHPEPKDED